MISGVGSASLGSFAALGTGIEEMTGFGSVACSPFELSGVGSRYVSICARVSVTGARVRAECTAASAELSTASANALATATAPGVSVSVVSTNARCHLVKH